MNDFNSKVDQISSATISNAGISSTERLPVQTEEKRKSKSVLKKKGNKTSSKEVTHISDKQSREGSSMNINSKQKD